MSFPMRPASRRGRVGAAVLVALSLTLAAAPVEAPAPASAQTINPVKPDNRPSTIPA